jgi:hypothetical protein
MASKQLLSAFGKRGDVSFTTTGVAQGLADIKVDIEDTSHLSKYFRVVEFEPVFTAGKNSISFNGSDFLQDGSEIKVEVLDSEGNSLYMTAPDRKAEYVDIANFTVAIYVYKETISGAGKVILVGTTTKGEIVRWSGNITINTTYPNVSRVRFYNAPTMEATPLLYPVIDNTTGSILGQMVNVSGNCNGYSSRGLLIYYYDANIPGFSYYIVSTTFNSDSPAVTGFNSQMIGQTITLFLNTVNAGTITNSTQSLAIKDVLSPTQLQLVSDVVLPSSPAFLANSFTGNFSMSYLQISHISQTTTVPVVGEIVPSGYMQLVANSDVFTSSMLYTQIQVNYGTLYFGGGIGAVDTTKVSTTNPNPVSSGSFNIANVVNNHTIWINAPPYSLFTPPSIEPVTNMSGSVTFLTSSNPYQYYTNGEGSSSLLKKSYVDILYRNTKTFSGFVARHKLYAKSNIYPGDFVLIQDSTVGPSELLLDQITANKAYAQMGVLDNQNKVDQYWFASSASLQLLQVNVPLLEAMDIKTNTSDYSAADGNSYVIAKAFSLNLINDAVYYPFDQLEFSEFTGKGYVSNFIFLPKNVLHILSANVVVDKDPLSTAKIEFYITSSTPTILKETDFSPKYGWKIGTIVVSEKVSRRILPDVQKLFFTPLNDYYGTLVIVPYNCNVILANISMKNYGDHGFSPDAIEVQLPFPVNVANESFTLKAELFDSNANLVYTIPDIIQTFDPAGASLFGSTIIGSSGTSAGIPSTVPSLTILNNLFLPGIGQCPTTKRLLGFNIPTHHPPLSGEGAVCYTDVTDLELTASNSTSPSLDYLSLSTTAGQGRSIAVRYSGTSPNVYGRRVYVDPAGTKTTYL